MLEYATIRVSSLVAPLLPRFFGYWLAYMTGELTFLLAAKSRRAVLDNVRHVLGANAEPRLVRATARGVFKSLYRNYYDLFRIPRFDLKQFDRILTIHGWEHVERATREGKGVILATAHLGNFDLVSQVAITRSTKITALVESLLSPRTFRLVHSLRASRGLDFVPASFGGIRKAIEALRRGEAVAIACDRDLQRTGIPVDFFGAETTLPSGAIELALRTGATVLPAFSVRKPRGRFEVYVEPPLELVGTGDLKRDVRLGMERLVAVMGRYIAANADQWVVFEPIWGDRHIAPGNTDRDLAAPAAGGNKRVG
ncbi:MAG: lysophospholipid acyltransferase family protein [Chloroflexi bacterium]|nr:lysophospholipid acyltransferase family protein [Chloroflexota bacterium]